MTKILVISGRKQAGKTTAVNGIFGSAMVNIRYPDGNPIYESFRFHKSGKLIVPAFLDPPAKYEDATGNWVPSDDGLSEGIFDPLSSDPVVVNFLANDVWPFVKAYNFADELKEFVIKVFGVKREAVFGTDEQKNAKTHLKWEDMPVPPSIFKVPALFEKHKKLRGFMTGRQVCQYFGTKICRAMYAPCWVEATLKTIEQHGVELAIIGDARFPDECELAQSKGGKVIRLTRCPHPEDNDASEIALDDWQGFDAVIDNSKMTMAEQHVKIMQTLQEWGFVG